jgi:hypothetical protein
MTQYRPMFVSPEGFDQAQKELSLFGAPLSINATLQDVYPECPSDFDAFVALLRSMDRSQTLYWCSRMNLSVSDPLTLSDEDWQAAQQAAINHFFQAQEIERIRALAQHPVRRVGVFFRGPLLELFRWALALSPDLPGGLRRHDADFSSKFARAVLFANGMWNRRINRGDFSRAASLDDLDPALFRRSLLETIPGMDPRRAIARGRKIIREILCRIAREFDTKFREKTGLTLEDYSLLVFQVMRKSLDFTPTERQSRVGFDRAFSIRDFCRNAPQHEDSWRRFLQLESATPAEMCERVWKGASPTQESMLPVDLRPLRECPILRLGDAAIAIDPLLLTERAAVGPIFYLKAFEEFGHAFHQYCESVLKAMYPYSAVLVNRLTTPVPGEGAQHSPVEVADACIEDVIDAQQREIMMWEFKSAWLPEAPHWKDGADYMSLLRQRYGATEDSVKGVAQIARSIRRVGEGVWRSTSLSFDHVSRIIPVLLTYDPLMEAPAHPKFLANEFARLLEPDEKRRNCDMRKGKFRVAPLIVMTLNDLEDLQSSIENFSLTELLREYSAACSERLVSLHDYVAGTPRFNDRVKYSQLLLNEFRQDARTLAAIFDPAPPPE